MRVHVAMRRLPVIAVLVAVLALAACGKKTEPPAAPAPTSAQSTPPAAVSTAAAPENTLGKSVYGKACALCHAAGVAGAPKPGDKIDWSPRLAQGQEVLDKHAIEGFNGSKGMMPARGGSAGLSDDEVKAAVRFMVDASR